MNDVREEEDDGDMVVHGEAMGELQQQPSAPGAAKLENEPAPSTVRSCPLMDPHTVPVKVYTIQCISG